MISSLAIYVFFCPTEKKKTSENGFVPSSPNLHPVIVAPTLAPQVSPRPTTQQSEPSRPLLQQPSNTSKQDTTAVAAQEVTGQPTTVAYHLIHRARSFCVYVYIQSSTKHITIKSLLVFSEYSI